MPPTTCQPELGLWSRAWRIVAVLTLSAAAWGEVAVWQWDHHQWWFWSDLGLGVLALALLRWRRAYPVPVAVATNVVSMISFAAAGPATWALASMATRRRWREIIPVAALALAAGLTVEALNPGKDEPFAITIPLVVLVIAVTVGWGMYIGSRRELLATLRERAETAEAEQAARVAQARTAERARIAREMHDVLAHRISLVTMHAGALVYRQDLSAADMRSTAGIIQDNTHEAMIELREVLGILRDGPGDADPELPQPAASDVPALIDEARSSGMRIDHVSSIDLSTVPESLGRTVYRVVQEALTNARKHAPDTLVTVTFGGGPAEGLRVVIRNPLPFGPRAVAPHSGLGLVGLAERTALAGGTLTHRITPERQFVLTAWLPWPA
ncbi:sensor histidine kinase [Aeromicrobium yanjiei]|uniref:histidine kinase n=1 Tax=Aeromicrobium yanjiei TaxID=2662028 RepID=A0A5Q2MLJ1_9ACTN|nr:histidine kinase [Aeromicrobium yanjiei]QGG41952.1 two-component sensor histidine kinase [Aeromicrobium yanjiei]